MKWEKQNSDLVLILIFIYKPKILDEKYVYQKSKLAKSELVKVAFFQKVRCIFHIAKINIPNHYPELEIRIPKLFTVMGRKFKFQVQDSDLGYSFWQWEKHIVLSEKKDTFSFRIREIM